MLNSLLIASNQIVTYVILGVLVVAIVVMFILSSRRRKKQEKETQDLMDAVGPGNKVKTIGGVCGIVVEVDNEENTFVLETGTEASGKSYMKFDRQAIYQTDAVVEKKEPETSEEVKDDNKDESSVENTAEPVAEVEASAEEQSEDKK